MQRDTSILLVPSKMENSISDILLNDHTIFLERIDNLKAQVPHLAARITLERMPGL